MSQESDRRPYDLRPATHWRTVFATASCFFLLTCSGRMGSSDSYTQLQAAVLLMRTGWVASDDPDLFDYCSVPSPSGRTYQAHDPGNILLFVPAAAVAVRSGGDDPVRKVPLPGRLAAALTYAFIGAACITAIYGVLSLLVPPRAAQAVTVLAACGTPLWIYARCTMDVLPGALGVGLTLWVVLAHADRRISTGRAAVLAAVAVAATGWFRASMLPFLAGPALIALLWNDSANRLRTALLFCVVLVLSLGPLLAYNYLRSGHPFVLGTMHPRYSDQNGFSGGFGAGLYGLLVSPNHGLFVFAPWLLLGLTPAALRGISPRLRVVVVAFLIGAAVYTVMIAGLKQWAKIEWGPRYLVPFLPVFVVPASLAAYQLWRTRWRFAVIGLAILSVAVTLPAGVVNYSYVITDYPRAADPYADGPYQILGSYHALFWGLTGARPDGPAVIREDSERAAGLHFPDLWTARLWERGGISRVAGLAIQVILLGGLARGFWYLARQRVGTSQPAEDPRLLV